MSRSVFALALLSALAGGAHAASPLRSIDYVPNRGFLAKAPRAGANDFVGAVEQVGEVVILEGDDTIVSDDGMGGYAIDGTIGQQQEIAYRFYTQYPDQFDELIVFTTFTDNGAMGAAAYEISAQQDIQGIGRTVFDETASYGATDHKLYAFVNMMRWDSWESAGIPIDSPQSSLYSVLGQEFAHRWLSFMHYTDGSGADSAAMLGRDAAHWASTLQADASVMDGNLLIDNGDGSFTVAGAFSRYSPLDLYGMGLAPATDVPAFFRVANAVDGSGKVIDPTKYLGRTTKIFGQRENITIDQIIADEGPRVPDSDHSPHAFRVAFVLLTRPGERAVDVTDIANKLDRARLTWEQQFAIMSKGLGSVCTQVSAPCGAPLARIVGGSVTEAGGNHNGVVEPGEDVWLTVDVSNPTPTNAGQVAVTAQSALFSSGAIAGMIDQLAASSTVSVPFLGTVPPTAQCGMPISVETQSVADGNTFRGFVQVIPGLTGYVSDDFESGWGRYFPDTEFSENPVLNGWQWGTPKAYRGNFGYTYQPDGGHSGSKCWFTGPEPGHRNQFDSSLGIGASSLYSKPIDMSKTYQPTLHYYAWFLAIDLTTPRMPVVPTDAALVVSASPDNKTWFTVDTVDNFDPAWRERDVPLTGIVGADGTTPLPLDRPLIFRYLVNNPRPAVIVEAGLDDISISTLTQACNPNADTAPPPAPMPAASGCSIVSGISHAHSGAPILPALMFVVAAALALAIIRRRARR